MDTTQDLMSKIQLLPDILRKELSNYADYLISKYGVSQEEEELTPEQHKLLDERLKAYESGQVKTFTREEIRQ